VPEPVPPTVIDHVVVTSPDLEAGATWLDKRLGVPVAGGGAHARMATHNRVVRTGESTYAEVIAIDPAAPAPDRPRWFDLDHAQETHLATWVLRSPDIAATASASTEAPGAVTEMARDALTWRITLPADGGLPLDGVGPHIIEWDGDPVALRLPASEARLISLTLAHPDVDRVRRHLDSLGAVGPIAVSADLTPHLIAAYHTPAGPRIITGLGTDTLSIESERQIAMDLFHLTWTYLDMDARTAIHDEAMVATAEASLWHWRRVGAASQWAIGEWQCSRVHAVLGHGDLALLHAQRCLDIAESERVEDFIPASAHEAMARAYAMLGDMDAAREQRNLAYRIAVDLDNEDRDIIEHDLGTLPIAHH